MLDYVNDFECTCPEDKSSIMLSLNQVSPDFDSLKSDENNDTYFPASKNRVAALVINKDTALELANAIYSFFEDDITE